MNRNALAVANRRSSPRVQMAARLWASGAVATKAEAAKVMGVHPMYLSSVTSMETGSDQIRRIVTDTQKMVEDETIDMSKLLRHVGRKAVGKLVDLMENGSKEDIQFRAAQDLADRSPDTQKTQRVQVEQFSLSGEDAKELAKAMVESARVHQKFAKVAEEGLVEVVIEERHGG